MFARTERLMLRPGWAEDAPALSAAIADEAVVRNLAGPLWPCDMRDAERFLSTPRDRALADFLMFVRTRGAPRLVGGIGLTTDSAGAVELGYWIARPYWGLGFATEAGRAVMALADQSLQLTAIAAGHFLDNPASGHVLRKLGFMTTGRIASRYNRARGGLMPCMLYRRAAAGEQSCDSLRLAA